jgi:gas vesicle protein
MRNGTSGNGNGTRRPEEILAEIHRTRDEMDHTLQAIQHRLTPGQLVDQGLGYLKNSGAREYVNNLSSSVKTHPLPATLTGIGIAWLMAVGNKRPARESSYSTGSTGSAISERMQGIGQGIGDRVQGMGDRMQSAKERVSQIGSSARQQLDRARGGWDSMLNDHPLALGAIGLAIGAVVAAMAPRTEKEDRLMGQARDGMLDKAKQAGTEKLEQMKEAQRPSSEGQRPSAEPQRPPAKEPESFDSTKWPPSTKAVP